MRMRKAIAFSVPKVAVTLSAVAVFSVAMVATREGGVEAQGQKVKIRGRCQACHKEAADEWRESSHAKAWQSEQFAKLSDNYGKAECLPCHAPEHLLAKGYGQQPEVRQEGREGGVDCVTCHEQVTGDTSVMHGTLGTKSTDHDTKQNPDLATVKVCASCHAKYGTVEEFRASKYGQQEHACIECHMPEVERPIAKDGQPRKTRKHQWLGPKELSDKALTLEASAAGGNIVVKLTSTGVGHKFPTGIEFSAGIVDVTIQAGGAVVLHKQEVLSDSGGEGGKDSRLSSGETRTFTFPTEGKSGDVTVRLLHKAVKALPDEQATVLKTVQLKV